MTDMSLDDFLGHNTRAPSGKGARALQWRKRTPPNLDFWFHTKSRIVSVWSHGFPRIVDIERDGERVREVWGGKFNCWEPEETCKAQYRRNDDGARKIPPKTCPMCLLLEHLHTEIRANRLSWVEPVFRFEDGNGESTVLTAGGMLGMFNGDLSRQEIAELKKAGIRRDEAWKQAGNAKCSYLFIGVDHHEADKGPQVLIETTALGDAVKRVVRDQIEALGAKEGNPMLTPYGLRFQYRPNEQEFSKKYNALHMPKLELSPEIRQQIVEAPLPDISEHIARGNAESLRTTMEAAALIELPWDVIFGGTDQREAPERAPARPVQVATALHPAQRAREEQTPAPAPARRRAAEPGGKVAPEYPPGTVLLPCDRCGAKMADTDSVCWNCGAEYQLDDAAPPAPPPPAAPLARPKPAAPPQETGPAWPGEGDDGEVGF